MKKYLLILLLFSTAAVFSQTKKKPAEKEKAPTQAEMQQAIQEMQQQLDNMTPEEKKMIEQMGVKISDLKKVKKEMPGASNAQLQQAYEDENRIVPKRDAKRIAAIATNISDASMKSYIAAIQKKYVLQLNQETISQTQKIFDWLNKNQINGYKAGNVAFALWIDGKQQMALCLMGKICSINPDTDNLANYAAMLSMMGGQQLAIPMLNNLHAKYPNNSTILNNLGQAWFGLGEITKAEKYLDSAIRLYPYHPQANATKSLIEESKGNTTAAIAALKMSIKHAYTEEKKDRLQKLGYKLSQRDIRVPFKPDRDPMGIYRVKRPPYPLSMGEMAALKAEWADFNSDCIELLAKLRKEYAAATAIYSNDIKSLSAGRKSIHNGITTLVLHTKKAALVQKERESFYAVRKKEIEKRLTAYRSELATIEAQRKGCVPEAPCDCWLNAENSFIKKYNELKQKYDDDILSFYRQYYNEIAFWSQYSAISPAQFDVVRLQLMISWLQQLNDAFYQPYLTGKKYECAEEEQKKPRKKRLAEFDDVACKYKSETDLYIMKFTVNCSKMYSKLDLKFIEYSRVDDFNRAEGDTYVSSTIKIKAEKGFDELKTNNGPLKIEAKIGGAIEIEMDRDGVQDIILSGELKAGIGTNVLDEQLEQQGNMNGIDMIDTTVEAGVEAKISLISGAGSVSGTGKLEGITITEW
jgi:tetratricopeptide (TPR) repeat protein